MRAIINYRELAIKPLDLNLLLTLAILIQTRSVSQTAQRLHVSQPTTSRALHRLRQILGDPLLVRSAGGMALTQRSVELLKPLEEWLALTSTVLEPATFEPATLSRTFHVAATDYGVLSVISPVLTTVSRIAPGCRLEVEPYSDSMFTKLVSGETDLVIYGFKPDLSASHARHLFSETQSLIVRRGHPLASGGSAPVPLDSYLAWPHIAIRIGASDYDHVETCLGERSAERRVVTRIPYFYAAPDLIGESDAVLTMPTRAATRFAQLHGFARLPAPVEIEGFDYWVLWHERIARDPAALWLIDILAGGGKAPSDHA